MSRYFVTDAPVPIPEFDASEVISDVRPNVIHIRPKMDVATKAKVTSEMFTLGKDNALEARLGSNELALLIHNIVRWEGPDFDGVPCDAAHIRTLDPTEPHIAAVLEAIAERNKSPKVQKASATTSTSTSATSTDSTIPPSQEGVSLQLASGVSRSPLLRSLDGHRERLES